jgi:hypothetical protein
MSIARRLITTAGGGEILPFEFELTVGDNRLYELPIVTVDGTQPNIQVRWGDGSISPLIENVSDVERFHTYTSAGTYIVSVIGSLPGFRVDNSSYKLLYTNIINWGNVGLRSINFYGCTNITTIPAGADGLSRVTQFNNTFRNTGITSIPSDLFGSATSAQSFVDTFSFTRITTIPNNLFDSCINATSFSSTFNACTVLVSVPVELFRYNTKIINFSSTFRNNRALTNIPTFQYNPNVTIFTNIFNMSSTTNGSSNWGNVEALWSRSPEPLGTAAFRNCTGITNYASIPVNWK